MAVMTQVRGAPDLRAQLLATEHWSLLATRSQTWSEVIGRITAQFTFASASLVVLALTVQVVGVTGSFRLMAIWLGTSVLVTGSLTALRVRNASQEDLMLVTGMNRLRAAYIELDPAVKHYLVTGWTEDPNGIDRTYAMGVRRTGSAHVLGSAYVFVGTVNVVVAAGLGAVLADTMGTRGALTAVLGAVSALLYAGLVVVPGHRGYRLTRRRMTQRHLAILRSRSNPSSVNRSSGPVWK
jgi:hypothetical protein